MRVAKNHWANGIYLRRTLEREAVRRQNIRARWAVWENAKTWLTDGTREEV